MLKLFRKFEKKKFEMKIFWYFLEKLNSDGEDPDLESEEIYFEDAQSL